MSRRCARLAAGLSRHEHFAPFERPQVKYGDHAALGTLCNRQVLAAGRHRQREDALRLRRAGDELLRARLRVEQHHVVASRVQQRGVVKRVDAVPHIAAKAKDVSAPGVCARPCHCPCILALLYGELTRWCGLHLGCRAAMDILSAMRRVLNVPCASYERIALEQLRRHSGSEIRPYIGSKSHPCTICLCQCLLSTPRAGRGQEEEEQSPDSAAVMGVINMCNQFIHSMNTSSEAAVLLSTVTSLTESRAEAGTSYSRAL